MLTFKSKGDFSKTNKFFERMLEIIDLSVFDEYGKRGVEALQASTPIDSGKTASSWSYEIVHKKGRVSVIWNNSNINNGVNIAIILQYGHGTRSGAYVQGVDYINPALKPVFDEMSNKMWEEVKTA